MRKFNKLIDTNYLVNKLGSSEYLGLRDKKVSILGRGNVGTEVIKVCRSLGMYIETFDRNDNLFQKVENADIVVNTLSYNSSTHGLLSGKFFNALKEGSYFITVTSNKIYDSNEMLNALKNGILAGVADDCGSALPGDYEDKYYQSLLEHPKILATPHIAYQSDVSTKISNDMMIDNVEAWIKGKPINILK